MSNNRLSSLDQFFMACWLALFLAATILANSKNPISFLIVPISATFLAGISLSGILRSGCIGIRLCLIDVPVLSFTAIALISALFSAYVHGSLVSVYYIFAIAVIFYLMRRNAKTKGAFRYIALGIWAIGIYEAIWGLIQYMFYRGSLINGQITGSMGNPGFYADLLMVAFSISMAALIHWDKAKKSFIFHAPAVFFLLFALFLTRSRGAAAAIFTSTTVIFLAKKGKLYGIALGAAALILILAFPNPLREAAFGLSQKDPYAYSRIGIWANTARMISEKPLIGVGPGLFGEYSSKYKFPVEGVASRYAKRAEKAHNEFLQVAVELGIVGLAAYLLGLVALYLCARRAMNKSRGGAEEPLAIGFSGALTGLLTHSLFSYNLEVATVGIMAATLSGCIVAMGQTDERRVAERGKQASLVFGFKARKLHYAAIFFIVAATIGHLSRPAFSYRSWLAGEVAKKSGEYERAIDYYRRAIAWEPGSAFLNASLGEAYFSYAVNLRKPQLLTAAVDYLEEALRKNPLDPTPYFELAMIYRYAYDKPGADKEKMLSESTQMLFKGLAFDPFNPSFYNELGINHMASGKYADAKRFFTEALKLEPLYLKAHYNLGRAYEIMGENELALREYNEIIKIRKKFKLGADSTSYDHHLLDFDESLAQKRIKAIEKN